MSNGQLEVEKWKVGLQDSFHKGIMIEAMRVRRAQKEKLKRSETALKAQEKEETAKKMGEARKIEKE